MRVQDFCHLDRTLIARRVAVIGDQHPFDAMVHKGLQEVGCPTSGPIGCGHMREPRRIYRQGVDQGFAQNDLGAPPEPVKIKHPLMRPRQIQV